jgi:hypothetical protein
LRGFHFVSWMVLYVLKVIMIDWSTFKFNKKKYYRKWLVSKVKTQYQAIRSSLILNLIFSHLKSAKIELQTSTSKIQHWKFDVKVLTLKIRRFSIDVQNSKFKHWRLKIDVKSLTFKNRRLSIDVPKPTFMHRSSKFDVEELTFNIWR